MKMTNNDYQKRKDRFRKEARKRHHKKKNKTTKGKEKGYLSEEQKKKLAEYRRNYHLTRNKS